MIASIATLLVSVVLAAPFGRAEASAVGVADGALTLDVRVEVLTPAGIVVAQPYDQNREPLGAPVPLSRLDGDLWGALVVVPLRSEMRIGFEIIDGSVTERSQVRTLVELGVDPAVFRETDVPPPIVPRPARSATPWGWIAAITGLAALALGFFALSPLRKVDTLPGPHDDTSGLPDKLENADKQSITGE
ncbi:MAG: hypothetical protein ACE5GC_05300 [Acidimicrobiia bacterium]